MSFQSKVTKYTTKYEDFDADKLRITDLEANDRSNGQLIGYVKYEQEGEEIHLNIQCPWFKIDEYGIPRIHEKYYPDDSKRGFVKVPMNSSIPEIKAFMDKMKTIDDYLASDDFKEKQFGKKASKYDYNHIIRTTEDDDGNEKTPYMKLKFKTSYPDGEMMTVFFNVDENDNTKEKVEVKTVTDATEHLRFMCEFRPIIRAVKVWAQNAKTKNPGYGIMFKIEKLQIRPMQNSSNGQYKSYYSAENDAFLSDSDDDVKETKNVDDKVQETVEEKEEEDDDDSDSDSSDSDSDSGSESESEEKPKTKGKSKGKSA